MKKIPRRTKRPRASTRAGVEPASKAVAQRAAAADAEAGSKEEPQFIVGIGASAGGLEALEALLKAMPIDTGMAFVIIQHLSPDFRSLMHDLLARHTRMPIVPVVGSIKIAKDTVYLLPPRKVMVMAGGRLFVHERPTDQGLVMPINIFFRSLAREAGSRAIGVVLSGTGTDGTAGLLDIHEVNGLVIVQSEESAKFDGMPRSAIDAGVADQVLPPNEIPKALLSYAANPMAPFAGTKLSKPNSETLARMPAVLDKLREAYGIDFNYYKPATISRRIDRRISLTNCNGFGEYSQRVLSDPAELELLYKDLLIGVTRFFRDPEAFEILEKKVIPELIAETPPDREIRIWVAGCATGEEAYSLAMLLVEGLEAAGRQNAVRVFASDAHPESLQAASDGLFEETSMENLSPQRRDRFFIREGKRFRVVPTLRRVLVLSTQNLIKDPPFTRMDMVSCRNLLIYFQAIAQTKALASFHFALRLNGVLFLGPSETTGEVEEEFEPIDRQWKIYRKLRDARLPVDLRMKLAPNLGRAMTRTSAPGEMRLTRAYDALLARYIPNGVLINERREVMHVFSGAERYLLPSAGRMSNDLLSMVRGDLRLALSSAVQGALKKQEKVTFKGVRAGSRDGGEPTVLDILADPIPDKSSNTTYVFLLLQETAQQARSSAPHAEIFKVGEATQHRITELEQELVQVKESLQATVEELETSNEELQASNEELLAANEELQSTNEELHSVNQELYCVNAEHEQKIEELLETTNDLNNLMRSTEIGTIFLDLNQCVRLFTPAASLIFNLIPQDIGRDIKHITYRVKEDPIIEDIGEVLKSQRTLEKKVTGPNGRSYLRRVMAYQNEGLRFSGLVITFVDVTDLTRAEVALREANEHLEERVRERTNALEASNRQLRLSEFSVNHAAVATLWITAEGRIWRVNEAACKMLGHSEEELLKRQKFEIRVDASVEGWSSQWAKLKKAGYLRQEALFRHADGHEFPVEVDSNLVAVDKEEYVFLYVRDVTERKKAADALQRLNEELEARVRDRTQELQKAFAALRESEETFRSLVEEAPQAIVMTDDAGEITLVNAKTEQLFGYDRREVLGQRVELLVPTRHRAGHPAMRAQFLRSPSSWPMAAKRDLCGRRKDGSEVPLEIGLSPLRIQGKTYIMATLLDIHRRKEAENALLASESRFRALAETLPQLVWTCGPDGQTDYVGPQWVAYSGLPTEDHLGDGWISLIHPEDRQHAMESWKQALGKAQAFDAEFRIRSNDGVFRWFKSRAIPLPGENGAIVKWFGANTDIDDLRRTEAEVRGSLREKETLLKEIHHRVKNNMQLISSLLQLQSDYIKDPDSLSVFREGQNRIRSMALIHEKLYRAASLARIDFAEYLESLDSMLRPTYSDRSSAVNVDIRADVAELPINTAIPLALILNELISNSLKHGFPNGRRGMIYIELKTHPDGELILRVRDDGVGLPPGMDWQEVDSLGLHLVRILTNQLGGSMEVTPEPQLTFTLSFRQPGQAEAN